MEENSECKIPKLEQLLTREEIKKSENINKITDKVYLGDEEGAKDIEYLKNENIHNIISVVQVPPKFPDDYNINLKHVNLEDCLNINIIKYLKDCVNFIERSDKVYIHCTCGVNRSAAIAIGYLMWKTHSNYNDAFNYVKQKRNCIELNNIFIMQLNKFHTLLKNSNYDLDKIDFNNKKK